MTTSGSITEPRALSSEDRRVELLGKVGVHVLRYGLVFLLLMWGAFKFAAFEAEATLSFLFTTPGALGLTSPFGGFLKKDIMLLGAALFTAAEALGAARSTPRTSTI